MTDTSIYERDVIERDFVPVATSGTPFSWSAAIAGTFVAAAISFIIIALGSGIGLSFASPFGGGPSATSLTVAAAVWLVMAQTFGFASGGYLAARLRSPAYDGAPGESAFRDAAQGLVVWALGVAVIVATLGAIALFAAGATARVANEPAATSSPAAQGVSAASSIDYFVDLMFRPGAGATTAGAQRPAQSDTVGVAASGAAPTLSNEERAEARRILLHGITQAALDNEDRAYLAQLVSARSGLPMDEAQRHVVSVENRARDAIKEAADKTAKAGAYFSFWTFMSLLFGAVAATLAGILGGQLRDAEGHFSRASRAMAELS